MEKKNHDERIRKATDIHVELMDLSFKMSMTEEVDFNKVMDLLREAYKDQLTLINMLHKYESDESIRINNETIQVPEFSRGGVQ